MLSLASGIISWLREREIDPGDRRTSQAQPFASATNSKGGLRQVAPVLSTLLLCPATIPANLAKDHVRERCKSLSNDGDFSSLSRKTRGGSFSQAYHQ